jgi:hypothetical protein
MRIAGAYTNRQLLRLKLRVGLPCLLVGALGLWGSQHLSRNGERASSWIA